MNRGFEYREQIGAEGGGLTVGRYLATRHPHSSATVWEERIATGEVLVAGTRVDAARILRAGERLAWRRPPWEEPEVPLAFAVLYLDEAVLAVAKPRGLPTMPAGGFLTHTLLHVVQSRFPEATPMHRLGRGTSGLVLFARTAAARSGLARSWRGGEVEKTYRALVSGLPAKGVFEVRAPIGPVPHPRLGRVHAAVADGKPSLTRVRVLGARAGNAIVEAVIPTGRPHQIRIHLAVAGYPLVGDPLYVTGGVPGPEPALPGEGGYRLHAERLVLPHPDTGGELAVVCAPPPDLRIP